MKAIDFRNSLLREDLQYKKRMYHSIKQSHQKLSNMKKEVNKSNKVEKSGKFKRKIYHLKWETDKNDRNISVLVREETEVLNDLKSTMNEYSNCKKTIKKLQKK